MSLYVIDQFASVQRAGPDGGTLDGLNRRTVLLQTLSPDDAVRQAATDAREREAINTSLLAGDDSFLSSIGLDQEYITLYRAAQKTFTAFAHLGCSVPIEVLPPMDSSPTGRTIRVRSTSWRGPLYGLVHELEGFDCILQRGHSACAELLFRGTSYSDGDGAVSQVLVFVDGDGSLLKDVLYRCVSQIQMHAEEEMVFLGALGVEKVNPPWDLDDGHELLDLSVFARNARTFLLRECVTGTCAVD